MNKNKNFYMVGQRVINNVSGAISFEKGYGGNNDGYYYKNEEVFLHGDPDEVCYISENDAEYSRNDLLAMASGNVEYATEVFYSVDWQSVEVYIDEDIAAGEVFKCSNRDCEQLHALNNTFKCPTCNSWFEGINIAEVPKEILEHDMLNRKGSC